MAQNNIKTWLIVILVLAGALFLGGMYTQKNHPLFAILPSGESNGPASCIFSTNENPYTASAVTYGNTGVWIAIDINSDGVKEKFGRYSSGTLSTGCTGGIGECTGFGTLLVKDYNSAGDDIYTKSNNVYIATSSGDYAYFSNGFGSASNAITTCTSTCVPDNSAASTTCSTTTFTNNCGQIIPGTKDCSTCIPDNSQASNTCIGTTFTNNCGTIIQGTKTCTTSSCLILDSNSNGKVDDNEVIQAINRWANNN